MCAASISPQQGERALCATLATVARSMAETEEVSLRPLSLRPGGAGANPFAAFGKGAGFTIRGKAPVSL